MLQVNAVSYSIGDRQILNSISFSLMSGNKVTIVGANGAGKSTLIKIIMGEISADEGYINKPASVGYVPQVITEDIIVRDGCTVEEYMMEGRGLNLILRKVKALLSQMNSSLSGSEMKRVLKEYSDIEEEFVRQGGYEAESEIDAILNGIGLFITSDRIVSTLSGGEKTRLAFARSLFAKSDLLILDEPTNHIDIQHYGWLGNYLKQINKTVLVVSHHPDFINPFTGKILEIEKFTGRMREYNGSYDDYLAQSAQNEQSLLRQIEWFSKEIDRLSESARRLQYGGPHKAKAAQNMFARIARLKKQQQELVNDTPKNERSIRMKFTVSNRSPQMLIRAVSLSKSFAHPIFSNVSFELNRGERLVILGANGSGKTTIVKILTGGIQPDNGSVEVGSNVSIGYYAQEHENLDPGKTVLEEIEEANRQGLSNLRGVLGRFLFSQEKVFQKVATLSLGEKSRLSLCRLIIGGYNLLILDEPTNYLDPSSREAVCEALNDYEGTVLFISHDYVFIRKINPDKALIMPKGSKRIFTDELLSQ